MTSSKHKRARLSAEDPPASDYQALPSLVSQTSTLSNTSTPAVGSNSSSFRNVSACNRCRLRKNRCDQSLPACTSCEKAGVKCVGFDPITKREIPRTYVYYLESRVRYLEELLGEHGIQYAPSSQFDHGAKPVADPSAAQSPSSDRSNTGNSLIRRGRADTGSDSGLEWEQKHDESDHLHTLVSNIGMVTVKGASDPRFLGSTSGISFARVVFAAVKSSVPGSSDKNGRGSKPGTVGSAAALGDPTMRDSVFGLQSKPNIKPAAFPDRELGLRLVNLYFEHANPQIPILHRPNFMVLFGRAYAAKDKRRSSRELYMLNIVFAIGAGTILEDSQTKHFPSAGTGSAASKQEPASPNQKKQKSPSQQRQPEEYHAAAILHLENFLSSMPAADRPEGSVSGLEQLQAVLLLAGFALLRPVAPGLWYITGVAVRLGVDLGLHYEDGIGLDGDGDGDGDGTSSATGQKIALRAPEVLTTTSSAGIDPKERGRREWVRDLRRRLWWCVYSFDRLVGTCVGRPFGVTDQAITTEWYSVLDDKDITPDGFLVPSHSFNGPSYKRVSHHYLRLRLLQSEILQVLQYRQAQKVHEKDRKRSNQYMHTNLSSPFLQPFDSFHAWRKDIDRRLWEWKESAPLQQDTTVRFSVKFLELNYWQAVIVLYRQTLSVPQDLAGDAGPYNDVDNTLKPNKDNYEQEDDIFLKVAEAGQRVLKLYRQLHRVHLVNYTYLATVHLFMAGIAFLYSIWHSPTVRSRLTLEDVDFTVLAATSVLGDLIDKCPPAEACRDAFDRMSKATIKMCMSSTGFGSQVRFSNQRDESPVVSHQFEHPDPPKPSVATSPSRPPPQFDDNWKDLFPETWRTQDGRNSGNQPGQYHAPQPNFPYAAHRPSFSPMDSPSQSTSTGSLPPSMSQQWHQRPPQYGPMSHTSTPSMHSNNIDPPGYDNNYDLDFLMNNENSTFTSDTGLNFGLDAHADWADGGGALMPDLFGGFFFGGPAIEGAAMDAGTGYPLPGGFEDAHGGATTGMWDGHMTGTGDGGNGHRN